MTLQPDHPDFTSAVFGEAPPEKVKAFEEFLGKDPQRLAESQALRHTADRLRGALKRDPVLRHQLTPAQRTAVFASATGIRVMAAGSVGAPTATSGIPASAAAAGRSVRRVAPANSWFLSSPALMTAGIAAAVACGMFFLSGPPSESTSGPVTQENSLPAPSASHFPKSGIPVIVLDTGTASGSPVSPGVPSPVLPPPPAKDPLLLPGIPLDGPASAGSATLPIATTPPAIRLIPAGTSPALQTQPPRPLTEIVPAPGAPPRRGAVPEEALTSPGSR